MLISVFSLLDECFVFWFLLPCWTLGELVAVCCLVGNCAVEFFSWPVQLVCSKDMPAAVGGWDTGMSWRKESWRKKVFVIHWALGQRGKSEHSRCSAIELGMRL